MAKGNRRSDSGFVDLRNPDKNRGTGVQIRDYLARVGSDYQMNIWRAVKAESEENGCRGPSWLSFQNFFCLLKRAELVVVDPRDGAGSLATDTPQKMGAPIPRTYYKLNPDKTDSRDWYNVYAALGYRTNR